MPLVACPDCGHHPVSDRAAACLKCGGPIAQNSSGAAGAISQAASAGNRATKTVGPLDVRIARNWRVYAANRPSGRVAEFAPSQVQLVPREIYGFSAVIQRQSELRLLEELANPEPLKKLLLVDKSLAFGDECLAAISGFTSLQHVDRACKPSFRGISFLKNMTSLESIFLCADDSRPVTDEAVMQLSSLPNLESIVFGDTSVARDGVNRLKQLRPNYSVERE